MKGPARRNDRNHCHGSQHDTAQSPAGMARQYRAADQGVPTELPAGGHGVFRLRLDRPDRRGARSLDQGKSLARTVGTRRHRRMADAALDNQDGVRRTGRHRADLRLAAEILRHHRRSLHGGRSARPRRGRRPMAHICTSRSTLRHGRAAADSRHRGAGRGCGRHVDGGRRTHRRDRQRTAGQRGAGRARHGPGARATRGFVPGFSRSRGCPDGLPT